MDQKALQTPLSQTATINPHATLGDIQQASQRAGGMGLLADYDEAFKNGNWQLASQIASQIASQGSNPQSPYAPYADKFQSLTTQLPSGNPLPQQQEQSPVVKRFLKTIIPHAVKQKKEEKPIHKIESHFHMTPEDKMP